MLYSFTSSQNLLILWWSVKAPNALLNPYNSRRMRQGLSWQSIMVFLRFFCLFLLVFFLTRVPVTIPTTNTQVRSMAKRIIRVAVMTASTSETVTATAARGVIRGLGDRVHLRPQRRSGNSSGGGKRDVRWVTVYVGVTRCEKATSTRFWGQKSFFFLSWKNHIRCRLLS